MSSSLRYIYPKSEDIRVMTTFADNFFMLRILCPVLALGLTYLLCRYGGRAVEVVEEEKPDYLFEFDADGVREGNYDYQGSSGFYQGG